MGKAFRNPIGFLILFIILGFMMKIAGEIVHEILGHGVFVAAFGGSIQDVYISLLWPYELSSIAWSLPAGITGAQMTLIYSGGITVSMVLSLSLGLLLWSSKRSYIWVELPILWLAFWCWINATGYLIIGGFYPFGDMVWLTANGYITPIVAVVVGALFFMFEFVLLSEILRRNLARIFSESNTKLGVVLFWFIVPIVVTLAILGLGALAYLALVPLSFVPVILSWIVEYWFNRKKN